MTKLEEAGFARRAAGFSRRDLVRAIGISAGGIALGVSALGGSKAFAAGAATSYASFRLSLELDGESTPVNSAEGGNAVAEVVVDPPFGPGEAFNRKHIGGVKFEDLILQVGFASSKALSGWINQTFTTTPAVKNGALVTTSYSGAEVRRLEFFNAVITEVTISPLDANDSGKEPFGLTLRISPESTRLAGPSGAPGKSMVSQKAASARFFRFNLQDLEKATARTVKVGALTVKRGGGGQQAGKDRIEQRQFGALDCSPVSITVPETDAGPLYAWFDDTVLKGNNGADKERAARIELLGIDMKAVVATIDLGNLGIVRYAPVSVISGKEGAMSIQVDMYCETLRLAFLV